MYTATGPEKMKLAEKVLGEFCDRKIAVLDIGGNAFSAGFVKGVCPKAEIFSMNISKKELAGTRHPIMKDIENGSC
ncbi:MAG: hypothetical protein NT067_00910, partial [Candidatus Diapherotrites archaeon]|nr:hypothetical protein [Candidatus Diapherotrites archaeon]